MSDAPFVLKPAVVGIIVKKVGGKFFVLLCKRLVKDRTYDPLYHNTWEAMGEGMREGETPINALHRGMQEEYGHDTGIVLIYGGCSRDVPYETEKGDRHHISRPFAFLQSMAAPQPWIGPVYVVEVHADFEPQPERSDGEAGEAKWWEINELRQALKDHPLDFMGFHVPALWSLTREYPSFMTVGVW